MSKTTKTTKNSKVNKYICVLDLGKDSIKALGFDSTEKPSDVASLKRISFKTKSYDLNKGYTEVQGNSFKVEYGDVKMIVGEQGVDRSFDTSKTSLLHQLCAYAAISRYLEPGTTGNEIYIVLACPVTVLKSESAKKKYKELIKGDGPINVNINGEPFEFTIKDVLLKAESSGILYTATDEFRNRKVVVIDFGGLNMTVTVFDNGVCSDPDRDRFAEEFGSVELINKVSSHLTEYCDGNIIDFQLSEEALKRGHLLEYGKEDEKSIEYITRAKEEFLNDAIKELTRHNIRLKNFDKAIFIGGTSNYLKTQITKIPNGSVTAAPQWSSVEGLLKIAMKKYKDI